MAKMTLVQAVNLAMREEIQRDPDVVVMGQDVGVDGGVFRATDGLIEEFGKDRIIDTPLAESGIVGSGIGMALFGLKPVCEIQFSGFVYQAFHQIEQHAARFRTRTRGRLTCPMVVRMPYGGGIRALEHHSESREAYFAHTPGLKMVIPSTPKTAHGLLLSAIRDPDPVIFFEPKAIYRAFREDVDEGSAEGIPLGKARVVQEGDELTLISYGASMRAALQAADHLEQEGRSIELIDLMTISPLDTETITRSVEKTGRAVVVHEAPRSFGVGAEILSRIVENSFLSLEAPIQRVSGYDTQMPFFAREQHYLPNKDRILRAAHETLEF